MRLFPRFSRISKSKKETARLFEERGIIYLPFARLANRIVKGEKFKQLIKIQLNDRTCTCKCNSCMTTKRIIAACTKRSLHITISHSGYVLIP
jgi:hypothetical protein